MDTSEDLQRSIEAFDIKVELFVFYLELLTNGFSSNFRDSYAVHSTSPGVTIVILDVIFPLNKNVKGVINIVKPGTFKYLEPVISNNVKTYSCKNYIGFKLYLHPKHALMGWEIDQGKKYQSTKVGVMTIKGRGSITFDPVILDDDSKIEDKKNI